MEERGGDRNIMTMMVVVVIVLVATLAMMKWCLW